MLGLSWTSMDVFVIVLTYVSLQIKPLKLCFQIWFCGHFVSGSISPSPNNDFPRFFWGLLWRFPTQKYLFSFCCSFFCFSYFVSPTKSLTITTTVTDTKRVTIEPLILIHISCLNAESEFEKNGVGVFFTFVYIDVARLTHTRHILISRPFQSSCSFF